MNTRVILILGIVLAGVVGGMFAMSNSISLSGSERLILTGYEFRSNCTIWFTYRATENTGVWAWNVRHANGTAISVVSNGGKVAISAGETRGMELKICGYGEFVSGLEYVIFGELWDYGFTTNLPDTYFSVTKV